MPFDRTKFAAGVLKNLTAKGIPAASARMLADELAVEAQNIASIDLGSYGKAAGCACAAGAGRGSDSADAFVPFAKLQLIDSVEKNTAAPGADFVTFTGLAGLNVTGAGRDSMGRRRDVRIFVIQVTGAGTVGRLTSMAADALANEPNVPRTGIPGALLLLDPQANWLMGARYLGDVITQSFTVNYTVIGGAATVLWGMFAKSSEFLRKTQNVCDVNNDD